MKQYVITEFDYFFLVQLKTRLYRICDQPFKVDESRDLAIRLDAIIDHIEEVEID